MKAFFCNVFLSNKKLFFIGFFVFIFFILFKTNGYYYTDTGDYPRVISGILNYDIGTQRNNFSRLEIKNHFSEFTYASSYTLIVYAAVWLTRVFSEIFNIQIFAALLKTCYIVVLFKVYSFYFKEKNLLNLAIFIAASIPLLSSANLGIFSSYYQEQLVLIFLPMVLIGYLNGSLKGFYLSLFSILVIATAKSQFFYLPLFAWLFYALFSRENIRRKTILLAIVQIISIYTAFSSSEAVNLNKYHSEYFGLYQYQKMSGQEIDKKADLECVGVDAWGHKFDMNQGAIRAITEGECLKRNSNASHKSIITYFLKNPVNFISLIFDEAINKQVRENYFHVFYSEKIVMDKDDVFAKIKNTKDQVFLDKKPALLLLIFILSAFLYKKKYARMIMFLSLFALSQLYISFFGEGYRDLAKHLFAMNVSFDLILFLLFIALCSIIREKWFFPSGGYCSKDHAETFQ